MLLSAATAALPMPLPTELCFDCCCLVTAAKVRLLLCLLLLFWLLAWHHGPRLDCCLMVPAGPLFQQPVSCSVIPMSVPATACNNDNCDSCILESDYLNQLRTHLLLLGDHVIPYAAEKQAACKTQVGHNSNKHDSCLCRLFGLPAPANRTRKQDSIGRQLLLPK